MTSELFKNQVILDWLEKAKKCYIEDPGRTGMCRAFKMAYLSDEKLEKVY